VKGRQLDPSNLRLLQHAALVPVARRLRAKRGERDLVGEGRAGSRECGASVDDHDRDLGVDVQLEARSVSWVGGCWRSQYAEQNVSVPRSTRQPVMSPRHRAQRGCVDRSRRLGGDDLRVMTPP
jgi:hypothetical protein